jgi:hypothetical protein
VHLSTQHGVNNQEGYTMEIFAIYRNIEDGIEAIIKDGNAKYNYRVVVRDIDADETITIRFCHHYSQCVEYAKSFFIDGYIFVESEQTA